MSLFEISEFAELNNVTSKMLRHYDEIGLLKPSAIYSDVHKFLSNATIGRAHGDEFVVFANAGEEAILQTAQSIIEDMNQYDFPSLPHL